MLKDSTLVRVYSEAAKQYAKAVATIAMLATMLRQLEDAGINCEIDKWDCATYLPTQVKIDKSQLPIVRKLFGRLTVSGKHLPMDYERSNELCVTVQPVKDEHKVMSFIYRTKHAGDKCRVVEQTSNAYTYKTLVCEV